MSDHTVEACDPGLAPSIQQVTSSPDSLGEAGAGGRWRGGGAAESYAVDDEPQCVGCIQYVCDVHAHTVTHGSWLARMKQVAQLLTRRRTDMELGNQFSSD